MQAYQTAPCPYCGATWNPPGAQTCANCRNQLPPPQAAYTPPGYAPGQPAQPATPDQPQYADPNQGYAPPGYQPPAQPDYSPDYSQQPQPDYGQQPQPDYGQQPQPDYGQQPQPDYGQQPQPGYEQQPNYGQQPQPDYGQQPGYAYPQQAQPPAYPPAAYPGYPPPSGGYPGYPQQGYPPPSYRSPGSPGTGSGQTINLFGQSITLPFSLPAFTAPPIGLPRVSMGPIVAKFRALLFLAAAIAVVWVFLNAVVPPLSTANMKAADEAVAAVVAHQASIDTALSQSFTPTNKDPMVDVVVAQTAMEGKLSSAQAALDQVKADEGAINSVDQHLALLSPVSGSKSGAIATARQRLHTATVALQKTDQVLTSFVDQFRQFQQLFASIVVWRAMLDDLGKHDPATALSRYSDAQQKLQTALTSSGGSDIPPASVAYTKNFQVVLDNAEKVAEATQSKDNAGVAKYNAAMQAGIRAQQYDTSGWLAWNLKTFQPLLDAYHAALRALKS